MRRALTPVVPPSMYRHFAVVTVLLTACLAMFAEGEKREAQAAPLARSAPTRPEAPAALANQAAPQAPPWWEVDSFSDSDTTGSGMDSGLMPDLDDVPGYSPEYLASLSEEERELLLAGLRDNGMLDPEVRESRSTALIAASSRRSGTDLEGD